MVVEPSPGACTYILTGTFTGYGPSGVSAARPVLAWLALIDAAC
jgi:hypothetical protein